MKQAVMTSPGKILMREVPTPDIAVDEVLVRPMRIGVCGSDMHVYHGMHPYTSYPVVQGHEVSAVVEKVGMGSQGVQARGSCDNPAPNGMWNMLCLPAWQVPYL